MFDTMTFTKILGGFCGAFLIFLLGGFFGEFIYHPKSHGDDHHQAYSIDTGDDGHGEEEEPTVDIAALIASADLAAGEKAFKKCAGCHTVEAGAHKNGPSLYGVVGSDIASADGFTKYTPALSGFDGDWTAENLSAFLENSKALVPNTAMNIKLKKPEERANLIAWLDSLDN